MLFECPLATQTWTLAQLPFHPGEFPSSSVDNNFDCLLNRVHKRNGSEDSLARIPWILWFLWKARNEKVFNNKEISPLEVLQSATSEASSWRLAQIIPNVSEENENMNMPELPDKPPQRPLCRFDASWKEMLTSVVDSWLRMRMWIQCSVHSLVTEFCSPTRRVQHFVVGHEILANSRSRLDGFWIRLLAAGKANWGRRRRMAKFYDWVWWIPWSLF